MLRTIDNKIHHLKELDFIERVLFEEVLSPNTFYDDLAAFLRGNDFAYKKHFTGQDLEKLDEFVRTYFTPRIEESKTWLLRAYIVGRFLSNTDIVAQIFDIGVVSQLPKFVVDAAKKYGLSLQEAKALQYAVEEGAAMLTNTTNSTIQSVRHALIETIKGRGDAQGVFQKLQEMITSDVGEINRDWQRVAISEINTAFSNAYLSILGENDFVVGISMPDACDHCLEDINGKVYRVRKEQPEDYTRFPPGSEQYKRYSKIWETEIWVGKNNFGRSSSRQKRIDPRGGNNIENLREKDHHEHSMPCIPYHPHCFKEDVEIYTEKGWQKFGELEKNIRVATVNKNNLGIEYQFPYEYIENEYSGTMYRLHSKNIDIAMTEGHNILTGVRNNSKDRKHKEYQLIEVKNLPDEVHIPISCNYEGKASIVQIGKHSLSEDLFAKLMGYYLSEGNCKPKKHGWEVKISQSNAENNKKIYEDLLELDVNVRKYDHSIQFNDKDICTYLMAVGRSADQKYIPNKVKNLSKKGILAFIDAYILGDGTIKNSGKKLKGQKKDSISKVIFTSSKQIADDFTEIILKAGYSVSYKLMEVKGKKQKFKNGEYTINHNVYKITVKNSKHIQKFETEKYEYSGKVFCVSVPNETILVRSNGKVLWIGNCRCRWIKFNPKFQYVKDGELRLKVENEDEWKEFYDTIVDKYNLDQN